MEEIESFEFLVSETVNNTEEQTVDQLLQEWDFPNLIEDFKKKGIDTEVFKELKDDDLIRLIPDESFGLRIKFRKKLYQWQVEKGCRSTATTTTVDSWLSSLPFSIISEPSEISNKYQTDTVSSPILTSSTATTESQNNCRIIFDLEKELSSSHRGSFILTTYKKTNIISKTDRQYIVQIAAEYLIGLNRRVTNAEYKKISQQIILVFPTEDEVTYYGNRNQREKLAEKYYSLSKKFTKSGLFSRPLKRAKVEDSPIPHKQLICNVEDQENNFLWLQKNFSPDVLVIEKWVQTFDLRRSHIQDTSSDILSQWPILKQKIGISLIELDFEKLFPNKSTLLFAKWNLFCEKIVHILKRDLKDPYCRRLLDSLSSITDEASKNYITTALLNGILVPPVVKGKGKPWKPSILDGQKAFANYLFDKSYIDSTVELKQNKCKEKNLRLQPFIIVIGGSPESITKFFIYFNCVLYEIDNFLKAISTNFQLHYVLGLEYAAECSLVWQLFEEYFYEMNTNTTQKRNTCLNALLNELKTNINN